MLQLNIVNNLRVIINIIRLLNLSYLILIIILQYLIKFIPKYNKL